MREALISCDWGLSAFRLRLLAGGETPEVAAECSNAHGIAGLATSSPDEFGRVLEEGIQTLFASAGRPPRPMPVCLSGMITSTLGWKQLPYAPLPFPLDGSGAIVGEDRLECGYGSHRLFFVSGVRADDDAMRGEECEVVGIFSTPGSRQGSQHAIAILPGTHSKSIEIRRGAIVAFRTFMTGELFELLCRHSVLSHSVGDPVIVEADEWFDQGVRRSAERGLLGSLFSVRARALLEGAAGAGNRRYLSGLLIGDELKTIIASHPPDVPLVVAGTPSLQALYVRGLAVLGARGRTQALPASITGRAASLGHWRIFSRRRDSSDSSVYGGST
jgi:2-dehydro-3-deoxygalactonokinase